MAICERKLQQLKLQDFDAIVRIFLAPFVNDDKFPLSAWAMFNKDVLSQRRYPGNSRDWLIHANAAKAHLCRRPSTSSLPEGPITAIDSIFRSIRCIIHSMGSQPQDSQQTQNGLVDSPAFSSLSNKGQVEGNAENPNPSELIGNYFHSNEDNESENFFSDARRFIHSFGAKPETNDETSTRWVLCFLAFCLVTIITIAAINL